MIDFFSSLNKLKFLNDKSNLSFDAAFFENKLSSSIKKLLVLISMDNLPLSVSTYLYCLSRGHTTILINKSANKQIINEFKEQYKPNFVCTENKIESYNREDLNIQSDLALLLATSGSTGKQKCVKLSYDNLISNMNSIAEYLDITRDKIPLLNLPLSYSYGISVLHSHLLKSNEIIFSTTQPLDRDFFEILNDNKITNIYGVPFTIELLVRRGISNHDLQYLTDICQAGGHLSSRIKLNLLDYCEKMSKNLFVMYGQTEAAPRISFVPPEMLRKKIDSIGIAIPGGKLSIDSDSDEIIYEGKNVMLGYASNSSDLMHSSPSHELRTGDLGYKDSDGYFYITGRLKRIIKIAGTRYNLDSLEKILSENFTLPVYCLGNDENLFVFSESEIDPKSIKRFLSDTSNINSTKVSFNHIPEIPLLENKKIDYKKISKEYLSL